MHDQAWAFELEASVRRMLSSIRQIDMHFRLTSDKLVLLSYFILLILLGSFLLALPGSWAGPARLSYLDALFTSTSAVCVTGLITVDTALYTRFGQTVIMLLIQAGGLGLITFATIYLAMPRKRVSLVNRGLIKEYYVEELESAPKTIVRHILTLTLTIEAIGALMLAYSFRALPDSLYLGVFHSVSAFCNAGFSLFTANLEGYAADPLLNTAIMGLIIAGGIGFTVLRDIGQRVTGRRRRLTSHSRAAILVSAVLIIVATGLFYAVERDRAFASLSGGGKILASLFQAVTPRTAGFDTIPQASFSGVSVLLTILLMFIGASPASTGGGIKTTTFYVILLASLRGVDDKGNLAMGNRSIPARLVLKSLGIVGKAVILVLVAIVALLAAEAGPIARGEIEIVEAIFEVVSAFGTVGLSLGITASLSSAAKLVLILTMFAGRVGLFAMALPGAGKRIERFVDLPETGMLVG